MIQDEFVRNFLTENKVEIIDANENKPWGAYYVFEQGSDFDRKILKVKPGKYLSLQYHGTTEHVGHSEKWLALTDFAIVIGSKSAVGLFQEEIAQELQNLRVLKIQKGDSIDVPSGFMHALVNPFQQDIYVQEMRVSPKDESSSEREENIVRIYDQTQRDNLPNWPEDLNKKIQALEK